MNIDAQNAISLTKAVRGQYDSVPELNVLLQIAESVGLGFWAKAKIRQAGDDRFWLAISAGMAFV